ncbi:hypothetical protein UNH65_23615 [Chitinophaga sp. 180180018-2]|nr:hypothetical protein [Chitinophaga sp. 212800010-3]
MLIVYVVIYKKAEVLQMATLMGWIIMLPVFFTKRIISTGAIALQYGGTNLLLPDLT